MPRIHFRWTASRSPTSKARFFPTRFLLMPSSLWKSLTGAPPAEFGEKASVVINVTTRSGQGMTTPHGDVTASYGSFGTSTAGFNLGYGSAKWGNFISVNGLNSGRFLDPPEFTVIHAKGNEENIFRPPRLSVEQSGFDPLELGFTRSWFQTPNSFRRPKRNRLERAGSGQRRLGSQWQRRRSGRPAFADQDLQHGSHLDAFAE